ncbi:MAG TPA: DinB family protein [Acidimicrobiales bacterium]|nr:DinB family protein [Acidimicrobiales bacterium]
MADLKPPRNSGSETEVLRALLQYQRESLVRKMEGVAAEAGRWSPVPSGTNLLWLARHMARAELTWVVARFAGEEVELPPEQAGPTDSLAAAIDAYRSAWQRVDAIAFGGASLEERCRRPDAEPSVSLRWVLMHLLEETARHAGHADIITELIDGRTGR